MRVIDESIVEGSQQFRLNYSLVVDRCLQLRRKDGESISSLAKMLNIDRGSLSNFERLNRFDIILASNILEYYGEHLTIL